MVELNSQQLNEKIQNGEKFVIDFFAPWCGPCKMLTQIIERSEGNLNVPIYKYNVESDRQFTAKFGVRSVPTLKLVNEGQIQKTHVGLLQESQLQEFVI